MQQRITMAADVFSFLKPLLEAFRFVYILKIILIMNV